MNRYAFTFTVEPETAGAVAGVLAYYLPGMTLAKNGRVLHVTDTEDDLDGLDARLSGRSRRAPITQALAGCWRPSGDATFVAATVMETTTHYERMDRDRLAADGRVDRCALLLPVHTGPARVPAGLLDSVGAPGRVLLSSTVFRHSEVVVWFRETRGAAAVSPPESSAGRAMTLLSATHGWRGGSGEGLSPASPPSPIGGIAHAGTHR
ncbi:hypothetical protein ACTMTJ_41205 [Phytohabitans sp. LJ34]|uniref:hypothetical protein n=1 Tax=Phytohabitans sp. LJ34 TaxID=3452217 RepID=UPI003F89B071